MSSCSSLWGLGQQSFFFSCPDVQMWAAEMLALALLRVPLDLLLVQMCLSCERHQSYYYFHALHELTLHFSRASWDRKRILIKRKMIFITYTQTESSSGWRYLLHPLPSASFTLLLVCTARSLFSQFCWASLKQGGKDWCWGVKKWSDSFLDSLDEMITAWEKISWKQQLVTMPMLFSFGINMVQKPGKPYSNLWSLRAEMRARLTQFQRYSSSCTRGKKKVWAELSSID